MSKIVLIFIGLPLFIYGMVQFSLIHFMLGLAFIYIAIPQAELHKTVIKTNSERQTYIIEGDRTILRPEQIIGTQPNSSLNNLSFESSSTRQIKLRDSIREQMCHACRGRRDITFECPNCKNYYCSDCVLDLNNRCIKCNIELNRRNSSQRSIGRYDCYVCKNGFDSGFKCPKCGKNYCQNCGLEADENCLNCSSILEKLA